MQTTYKQLWAGLRKLYEEGEARAIVRLVLETKFDMSYTDIVCGGVEDMSEADGIALEGIMSRLYKGEPVQYVLGEAEFCGNAFTVCRGVLIPRPETAEMVQAVAGELSGKSAVSLLDVCTGSGCIAVSLALQLPDAYVEAWDVSDEALSVASGNAVRLGATVNVVWQDALLPPDDSARWTAIVSNPPYVMECEKADMARHVLDYEPSLALFVPDDDPLLFYTSIARYAAKALVAGGLLYFEINPLCAAMVETMLRDMGFVSVAVVGDQYGRQRFVKAYRQ